MSKRQIGKWHLLVKDGDYSDPEEVVYHLVRLKRNGQVLETDAILHHANHGLVNRLREALGNPMAFEKVRRSEPTITITKAKRNA